MTCAGAQFFLAQVLVGLGTALSPMLFFALKNRWHKEGPAWFALFAAVFLSTLFLSIVGFSAFVGIFGYGIVDVVEYFHDAPWSATAQIARLGASAGEFGYVLTISWFLLIEVSRQLILRRETAA